MPADIRTEYLRASAAAVDSVVADYRASAGIDLDHELGSGACSSKGRLG
jgi:haloacetate dehalogenase